MGIGQQWAVGLIVLWICSIWFTYSIAYMRGETSARREATKVMEDLHRNAPPL